MALISKPRLVTKRLSPTIDQSNGNFSRIFSRDDLMDPFVTFYDFTAKPPAPGFPNHPHRGTEAVTGMLKGAFKQLHNNCFRATLNEGDWQWTTMGRGFIHSELPAGPGENRGLQFWVNLPSKDRMIQPNFNDLSSANIKKVEKDGVEIKVVAGEAFGVKSQHYTKTPTMFLDCTLKPNSQLSQSIPGNFNAFVYVIEGEGVFGTSDAIPTPTFNAVILGPGDGLHIWNKSSSPLRFVIAAGQPLNESYAMKISLFTNTQADLVQTIDDYKKQKYPFQPTKC